MSLQELPQTSQAPAEAQGRDTFELVVAWLNWELAVELRVAEAFQLRAWCAALTEEEADRLLQGLWEWNSRVAALA